MSHQTQRQTRFLDLVHAHQGVLRRIAALYARAPGDRQDLVQDMTLALWRSFDSFRGESAFSTFLYRVALNTAVTRVRRAGRRPVIDGERPVEDVPARTDERDDEEIERLYAAIRQLGPVDRAITLMVLDERGREEIAQVTGLSAANVRVRLARARERLRKALGAGAASTEGARCSTSS